MARDRRRAVLAAFAALAFSCACMLETRAQTPGHVQEQAQPAARGSARKRQDPAEAQRAIEGSLKHLQAGRADQAAQAMSATLAGGNLPPAILAKAFYVRGMAYRQMGQPAQAVSDLSSALWLKGGLGGDERAEAMREKAAAYADAGLAGRGETDVTDRPRAKTSSSGSWLSGLFGAPSQPPARPPQAPAPVERAPPPAPAAKAPPAATGGWGSQTEVVADRAELAAAPAAKPPRPEPQPAPDPPKPQAGGEYLVQLNAVRTEPEARALAAKAKREHAVLATRQPTIDRAVFGNMGAFYLVRFGPFASAEETRAVCSKLQGSGLDCLPVDP